MSKKPSSLTDEQLLHRRRMKQWMDVFLNGDKPQAKDAFQSMKAWWAQHAKPKKRSRRVQGVLQEVQGWDIPAYVREMVIVKKQQSAQGTSVTARYSLLNIAVMRKSSSLTEWLLLGGWDPNFYSGLVTPVGQAMYSGDLKGLTLMRDFGADLVMELRAEHGSKERPIRQRDVGSTALHRVMEKPDRGNKAEIVQLLVEAYPNPLPKTALGETPLDWAVDSVGVEAIRREVARREHASLTEWSRTTADLPVTVDRNRHRL